MTKAIKTENTEFYMVWTKGTACSFTHHSYRKALKEAARLTLKYEGKKKFFVLKATTKVSLEDSDAPEVALAA